MMHMNAAKVLTGGFSSADPRGKSASLPGVAMPDAGHVAPARQTRGAGSSAGPLAAFVAWLCHLDSLYRQRRALARMDARQRADLGLTQQDIAAALGRRPWQG